MVLRRAAMIRVLAAGALVGLLSPEVARGQGYNEPNGAACAQYVQQTMGATPAAAPDGLPCNQIAVYILSQPLSAPVVEVPKEAVQPIVDVGGTHGGPGQASSVPSVLPTPNAGATVSASGTPGGPELITEIRFNPLALAASNAEDEAYYSRVSDVRLLLPVSSVSAPSSIRDFQYAGVRVLVNMAGIGVLSTPSGEKVYQEAQKAALKVQQSSGETLQVLLRLLETAPDLPACANALQKGDEPGMEKACGGKVSMDTVILDNKDFLEAVEKARIQADSNYWGLDLRGDFGDPTLSGDATKRGTYLSASVAGGSAFIEGDRYLQPRWRVGATYAYPRSTRVANYSLDAALGFELGVVRRSQRVKANIGIEARVSKEDAQGDTNFYIFNVGLTVPTTQTTSVSVGLSLPLSGDRPTLLTLGGDFSLLFGGR